MNPNPNAIPNPNANPNPNPDPSPSPNPNPNPSPSPSPNPNPNPSQADSSLFGGPARTTVGRGGGSQLSLEGCRHFIYGPGEGGITIEYLYSAAGQPTKVRLARPARN